MPNYVFYDFETCSSNVSYGQIIEVAAVLVNDNFQELDRFESRCKLSPGIIPEAMALLVNKTSSKMLKERNLSHYQMIRQMMDKFNQWKNSIFIGYNSLEFDEEFFTLIGDILVDIIDTQGEDIDDEEEEDAI